MFSSTTIIRELVLNLAKVIFMLKHSVKLRCSLLFGDVATCRRAAHVLCAVLSALLLIKEHIKIYIKIHTNIAPTCFGLRPSSGSLH